MRRTDGYEDGMLLVRRPSPGDEILPRGADVYVVVEVGSAVDEPPLARCVLIRLDEQVAEIRELVVVERFRGRGVAERLVGEIADVLRAGGTRRLLGIHDGARWLDIEL